MFKIKFDYIKKKDKTYLSNLICNYIKEKKIEINTFNLGLTLDKNIPEEEKIEIKLNFQKQLILEIEKEGNIKRQNDFADIEIIIDFTRDKIELSLRPVYIYGRYIKHSRNLPQTIHYCFQCKGRGCPFCNNTGKISSTSVQEILTPIFQKEFEAQDNKFHGCGREDIDVRMLGNGRPFVIELINSKIRTKTQEQFNKIISLINNKDILEIKDLRFSNKKEIVEIKNTEHKKKYLAKVSCEKQCDLNNLEKILNKELEIKQQTPLRVMKRRANIIRTRKCSIVEINKINNLEFKITFIADGGLYIKELISSDENRTIPSISQIINNTCICKELDVLEII